MSQFALHINCPRSGELLRRMDYNLGKAVFIAHDKENPIIEQTDEVQVIVTLRHDLVWEGKIE